MSDNYEKWSEATDYEPCPGGKSTRYNIDPNYAAMIAAGRIAEDAI